MPGDKPHIVMRHAARLVGVFWHWPVGKGWSCAAQTLLRSNFTIVHKLKQIRTLILSKS